MKPPDTLKPEALIYARVSSERQKKEGHGLDSQEHRCREYAITNGYVVEKVFSDSSSGGGDFMERPAMADLLAYIDSKPHKEYTVIFDDLKRFARDTAFHLKLRTTLKARNATPKCLNFIFEDTPEGQFVETIMAAGNELERQQNRRQVIQKQKARLERGYWPFFPPPGYANQPDAIHGRILTPNKLGLIIKEALEGFSSGRFQEQTDVLNFLRQRDFRNGKKIHLSTVKRLLTRIIYAGYIEYPDWEVSRRKAHHEALIMLETYEKNQDRLNGKATVRTGKRTREDFPLRGFLICSHCPNPYTASWTTKPKGYRRGYYRCNQPGCPFKGKSIEKSVVEKDFDALLKRIKPKVEVMDLTKAIFMKKWEDRVSINNQRKDELVKELGSIEEQVSALSIRAAQAKSEQLANAYENEIEKLHNKKLLLQERIGSSVKVISKKSFETALNQVFDILKDPYTAWSKGDFGFKKVVLKVVFAAPVVYNKNSGFETAILSLPLRVFELFTTSKSQGVEMLGIEPRCNRYLPNGSTVVVIFEV